MSSEGHETILVVEDESAIRAGLQMNLRAEGYRTLCAADAPSGLALALERDPDLMLLDLMLPGGSGLDLLSQLRRAGREMPVLILTALGRESDVVAGLKRGADDYISKPFSLPELLARVAAALRRQRVRRRRRQEEVLRLGDVEIRIGSGEVLRDNELLSLTSREFDLLLLLARHPDRVYSRDQLLEQVWGLDYEGTSRTVDNFICSLRGKVEQDPAQPTRILTVRGKGYRFKID